MNSIVNQEFDIIPIKKHFGMSINYIDLQESRLQFIQELINTILDWVYSKSKQTKILDALNLEGRTIGNSYSELLSTAHDKFRTSDNGSLLHGQFGELLLSNCIQRFFSAVPILRKMPITTSPNHERFGADTIHYNYINGENLIYLGEAKSYTSKYKFNQAFEDALDSILSTYSNITKELRLYLHEDFLEPELQLIATDLINGKLKNVKIQLVSIISYDENKKILGSTEDEIKFAIINSVEVSTKEKANS